MVSIVMTATAVQCAPLGLCKLLARGMREKQAISLVNQAVLRTFEREKRSV
jgi:hypothetical protein